MSAVQPGPESAPVAYGVELVTARPVAAWPPLAVQRMSRGAALVDAAAVVGAVVGAIAVMLSLMVSGAVAPEFPSALVSNVLVNGSAALGCTALLLRARGHGSETLGLGRERVARVLARGGLLWLACYPVIFGAFAAYLPVAMLLGEGSAEELVDQRMEFMSAMAETPRAWVLPLMLFVGVYEEVLFRGVLLSRLAVLLGSRTGAVLASSLLFGLLHFEQGLLGMFQTAGLGMLFACAAIGFRSLWPSIAAHALFDTGAFVLMNVLLPVMREWRGDLRATMPGG